MLRPLLSPSLLAGLIGLVFALGGSTVEAQTGVGINVGIIRVDQGLAPGGGYHLPHVGVINTGHVPGDYGIRIIHRHQQQALRPPQEWFSFEPDRFNLEPGLSQNVEIGLTLPDNARPGDYFAFIEAYRVVSEDEKHGGLAIQLAAATKLYFTVVSPKCDFDFE